MPESNSASRERKPQLSTSHELYEDYQHHVMVQVIRWYIGAREVARMDERPYQTRLRTGERVQNFSGVNHSAAAYKAAREAICNIANK